LAFETTQTIGFFDLFLKQPKGWIFSKGNLDFVTLGFSMASSFGVVDHPTDPNTFTHIFGPYICGYHHLLPATWWYGEGLVGWLMTQR